LHKAQVSEVLKEAPGKDLDSKKQRVLPILGIPAFSRNIYGPFQTDGHHRCKYLMDWQWNHVIQMFKQEELNMLRYVCSFMCFFALFAVAAHAAQTMSVGSGPYTPAIVEGDSGLPDHTVYRPKDLESFSKKNPMPVLAWGNGGCSSSSQMHANFLAEVASQGFLVLALGPYREPGAGRGGGMMGGGGGTTSAQMLEAIDWATKENKNKDSKYYEKLDPSLFAVAGMSCGGIQALEVAPDPRVKTTLVMDSGLFGGGGPGGGMRGGAPGGGRGGAPGAGAPAGGMMGGGMRGGAPGAGAPAGGMMGGGMRGGAPGAGAPAGGMMGGGMMGRGAPGAGAPGAGAAGAGARRGGGGGGGGMMGMPNLPKEHLQKLHSPVIYIEGGPSDIAYANGKDDYEKIEKVPIVFASYDDVGHGGTYSQPNGGEFGKVAGAWLKWQLKGDDKAKKMFVGEDCGLCKDDKWEYKQKNLK
jgi:hypothetical protein